MPVMMAVVSAMVTAVVAITAMMTIIPAAVVMAILDLLDITYLQWAHCREGHRRRGT